ncbi:MAG: hypothetical protein AB2556_25865 [Candidatus Thiodiazotropha sp.]
MPSSLLFLVPAGEDWESATDEKTPIYGHFHEKEVETLGGAATWALSGQQRRRRKTVWPPL